MMWARVAASTATKLPLPSRCRKSSPIGSVGEPPQLVTAPRASKRTRISPKTLAYSQACPMHTGSPSRLRATVG
ncbi:MAG: hypothetical protein AW08_01504 [Candidatus Accumulibacter adjunctus]|uniref:Uncharacterized protein n=1 Tax=Candidatus Accumulibacter adjunctus TaxID=1454001 RepID=A0A011NTP3_9PROT|nr:MAG: hypothetical protein AW08_01504 [Candidatus Accumulibacter adjunctus]